MWIYKVENLTFQYKNDQAIILNDISFEIHKGDFCVICGKSGSGKTTLLQLLKKEIKPSGYMKGNIHTYGIEHSTEVGYLFQNPDFQIVTHKVINELSFGLENMGISLSQMKRRIGEVVHFFNLQSIIYKDIAELSGGQKQLVNLASIVAMQPKVMLLDEPTAQLDPIASQEFMTMLKKINEELNITIIVVEHDLEQVVPLCDNLLYLDKGNLEYCGNPCQVPYLNNFEKALPVAAQLYHKSQSKNISYDFKTVRKWIEMNKEHFKINTCEKNKFKDICLQLKNVHFHYNDTEILKGLSLDVYKNEIITIVGGNGSGKSTLLKVICGLLEKNRGKICLDGKDISKIDNKFNHCFAYLPQDPTTMFLKETVKEELYCEESINLLYELELDFLLDQHPYDLSGGQMQLLAIIKVLVRHPQILLLDEPTKGLDIYYKEKIGKLLQKYSHQMTVIIVSHDLEFCAEYGNRAGMLFDGKIESIDDTIYFFNQNLFYTTIISKLTKGIFECVNVLGDIYYE